MSIQIHITDPRSFSHTAPRADWLVYYGESEGFRAMTLRFGDANEAAIYLWSSETAREIAAMATRAAIELEIEEGVKAAKAAARDAVKERHAAAVEAADGDAVPTVDELLALLR